ncbi:Peptidase C39 family protein [Tenacibaculum sp. MAR_2010_89]|uniref:vitamin K epoxide reductase family protein n=1 Tax=Tenacibaculum sp. MAR_2010_89 TaxID=1250198 RepID=UPI00089A4FBD|nr:vitamin K epoxide reductase family protein [Tenacibaculum sp. MAR_2010_89]SED63710.1 Peptidase C39 family protein [Tenacibaculum sp. MAR_2010_89]
MGNTLINIVQQLLKRNRIPFDKEELAFQIQSHPSYPSLHAITGVLDHFNIENVAADVPVNSETLEQLPSCYIVQVNDSTGQNLTVVEKKKSDYILYTTEGKKEKISEEEFLKKFTGIIVAVEKTDTIQTSKKTSKIPQYVGFGIISMLAVFLVLKTTGSVFSISHLLLSIVGIVVSVAIVKQELGLQTSIGDAFCSGADDKKDCDAVLTSKGAEIIKGYKLSDFSILYFSTLTLLTFLEIATPAVSYTISLVAIPITLYSIYYQYAVVKKWCLLCLSIVGLLWVQALIPVLTNTYISSFVPSDYVVLAIIGTSTWLGWSYVKPLISEVTELRKEKIEGVKFKRNYTLFEGMLNKSPQRNTTFDKNQEIVFGNPTSNLEIVVVTNPFCGHCKPVHKQVDEILHKYNDSVKIRIRFNINTEDKSGNAVKITSRLLELYNNNKQKECLEAMSEIYEDGNVDLWLKKWGATNNSDYFLSELEREKEWCKNNAINFTPEILINGRSFPKEYNRSDLIFFIEELEENSQTIMSKI